MLNARHHGGTVGQVGTLISLNHGAADGSTQEGVLAIALAHASPARLAAHVNHGAECPTDAVGCGLDGGDAGRVADGIHVPTHRQSEGNREYCLIAMNHVHTENQGDAQAALFDGHLLQLTDALDTLHVEQSAHLTGLNLVHDISADGRTSDDVARDGQVELSEFLLQGHLRHEVVDKAVHLRVIHALGEGKAQCTMHDA